MRTQRSLIVVKLFILATLLIATLLSSSVGPVDAVATLPITWSAPAALNTNATTDTGLDGFIFGPPQVTTDGAGSWVAVWMSQENLGGTIGTDNDILVARSTDNGATWSAPAALNTNATTDAEADNFPQVTTDSAGNWVAVWTSFENVGGTIGTDDDILVARSTDKDVAVTTMRTDAGQAVGPLPWRGTLQLAQGLVDGQHLAQVLVEDRWLSLPPDGPLATAALEPVSPTCVIHADLVHRIRRRPEEMTPALPFRVITGNESHEGLVNQRRRLKRSSRCFLAHLMLSNPPKLVVDKRPDPTLRIGVAFRRGHEKFSHRVRRW